MSEWLLEFPAPAPWLNLNSRLRHKAQSAERKLWRDATHVWAQYRHLPKGLERIQITATCAFPTAHRRDVDNYAPTVKACIDGLKDYGLVPDDNAKHVTAVELRMSDQRSARGYGTLALEIREV
jgi:Holliday junction resolvase RusA-like endonuclease